MSAPMKLNAEQLRELARALEQLTEITTETGVNFTPYDRISAAIGDSTVSVNWDGERYVIDDVNGY